MALIKYSIEKSYASTFKEALLELTSRIGSAGVPLRVVFMGNPLSQEQYAAERFLIIEALFEKYGQNSPLVTYVAQPPLSAVLVVEVQTLIVEADLRFERLDDHRYAVVECDLGKMLFTQGILPVNLSEPIITQSREVFDVLGKILEREDIGVNDISRQWNYIEQITQIRSSSQNYQAFNDARSEFYGSVEWVDGYPAATGIGTAFGGVMVEVDAGRLSQGRVVALDNSLQVAAHEYSKSVLLGSVQLSTPKFERAKAIDYGQGQVKVYISGTAAIRGEQSLLGVGIRDQTIATLENIEWLCSSENLEKHGIFTQKDLKFNLFRVYLKFRSDYLLARDIIERRYGADVATLYVLTDVCRDELLIEIEGIAGTN